MPRWPQDASFVDLALKIDQYQEGFVDAYFGPPALREAALEEGRRPLDELLATVEQIYSSTKLSSELDEDRLTYLLGELDAMRALVRILMGEQQDIVTEAEQLYGLTPSWVDEASFIEAHQSLEFLLPGSSPLAERYKTFRDSIKIPPEKIEFILKALSEEFRRRTTKLVQLPDGEQCEFRMVQEMPWGGFNWYLGNFSSRVDINQDFPIDVMQIAYGVSHEAYPGHHSERVLKERDLYRRDGRLEHSILLTNTPSIVIAEGIAEIALEMVAPGDEISDICEVVLQQAGIDNVDGKHVAEVAIARRPLERIGINRALLLNREGVPEEEVIDYGVEYGLIPRAQSEKMMEMEQHPLWRSYVFVYPMGYDLLRSHLGGGEDRTARFVNVLRNPHTVSQLVS